MNTNFVCEGCGSKVSATIWDNQTVCGVCGNEYQAHIRRMEAGENCFRWTWALSESFVVVDNPDGEHWEDMAFSEYIDQSIKLTAAVADYFDNNQEFPDVLHVAKLMGFNVDTVIQMAEDQDLCVNVAIGINGGVGSLPKHEWTIEPHDLDS